MLFIYLIGYDNSQHPPQQYNSGGSSYYQQGTVADWGGQLNVGGNNAGRVERSYLGVNNGGGNTGGPTTWNSGGGCLLMLRIF